MVLVEAEGDRILGFTAMAGYFRDPTSEAVFVDYLNPIPKAQFGT